jgi:hypothetical protein
VGTTLAFLMVCGPAGGDGTPRAGAATEPPLALPDTLAAAVWAYLEAVDYRSSWQRWPGKGEFYPGPQPHGVLLTTYLNPVAFEALTAGAPAVPPGSIVVKENYLPDSTLIAVTTMYKVRGYNPGHNDWFFTSQSPSGEVEVEGRVEGCIDCHMERASNDYLYTGALGGAAQ